MVTRCIISLVLLLASLPLQPASARQKRPPTPYGILHTRWKEEVKSLDSVVPALTGPERREQKQEINAAYTERFLTLARNHLQDDLWIDCLLWTSVEGVPGQAMDEMFDLLRDNAGEAGNTIQLQLLMSGFIELESSRISPALSTIAETHKDAGVRGAALFVLAARTKRHAEQQGDLAACTDAEKLLERVIAEYPDVHTYQGENRENAEALLNAIRGPLALSKTAPAFQGKTLSGTDFDLHKSIRGKVAIISFSGHWCGPCVAMHPIEKEIMTSFRDDQVVLIEVNSDPVNSLDKVREKVNSEGLDWTIVTDGSDGPVSEQWQIVSWPTWFVLDSEGRIRRRASGNVGRQLVSWVDELVPKNKE